MSLEIIHFSSRLLGLHFLIVGIEYLYLRKVFSENGIWRWHEIAACYRVTNSSKKNLLNLIFSENGCTFLNGLRVIFAFCAIVSPQKYFVLVLFLIHLLTQLRTAGPFNGGSDYMASMMSLVLSLGLWFPDSRYFHFILLGYVSIQTIFSYFYAGVYKLKNRNWLNGRALALFLGGRKYRTLAAVQGLRTSPKILVLISWIIIGLEVLSPLVLLDRSVFVVFIFIFVPFHFLNSTFFGLNRFVFVWGTTYPCLWWFIGQLSLMSL